MRTHLSSRVAALAALLLAAGCAPPPPAAPSPEPVKRVRIVHTNDFHGHLLSLSPGWAQGRSVGGSAVLAAHFDSAAARFAGPTFVLSAGDDMQGTAISNLSWGRATIRAHNAAGYDAAALGNHEFDWGLDTLRARVRESRFPWLGANVYRAGTREHPEWVRPWVMLERGGVRVAVVGAAYSATPGLVVAGRTAGLEFGPEAPAIDRSVREARAAGADFVVVALHVGAVCDSPGEAPEEESTGCEGELLEVAAALREPVDLMVGGHTHHRVLTTQAGVPLAEARRWGTAYSVTDLERRDGRAVAVHRSILTPFADEVTPDTAVARVVAEAEAAVRPVVARTVATLAEPMPRTASERGEYPLGNLIADAHRVATGAHVSLVNNGSIRRALPQGPVDYGMLYELQPFQNELVTVRMTGAQLRAALEHALDARGRADAHVSGVTVHYDPTAPRGARITRIVLDDGRVVADDTPVTLGTSEFVATGGDGYAAVAAAPRTPTGVVDLDALVQHLQSLPQPVRPPRVGRWAPVRPPPP